MTRPRLPVRIKRFIRDCKSIAEEAKPLVITILELIGLTWLMLQFLPR